MCASTPSFGFLDNVQKKQEAAESHTSNGDKSLPLLSGAWKLFSAWAQLTETTVEIFL